jgi:hypothetical protein
MKVSETIRLIHLVYQYIRRYERDFCRTVYMRVPDKG